MATGSNIFQGRTNNLSTHSLHNKGKRWVTIMPPDRRDGGGGGKEMIRPYPSKTFGRTSASAAAGTAVTTENSAMSSASSVVESNSSKICEDKVTKPASPGKAGWVPFKFVWNHGRGSPSKAQKSRPRQSKNSSESTGNGDDSKSAASSANSSNTILMETESNELVGPDHPSVPKSLNTTEKHNKKLKGPQDPNGRVHGRKLVMWHRKSSFPMPVAEFVVLIY